MLRTRPFRFGIQLSGAATGQEWVQLARKAEDLGYSSLLMPDHFGEQLAPIPALMAVADHTSTLRIGTLVLDNDYRHPAVLAKEAATVDLLSGGRLELGIGAGWQRSDYDASGIRYDPPAVRVDRLEEALTVLKGLLAPGPFSFSGRHYEITNLEGAPRPAQQPRPPLLVGGGGPRVLGLAGREADIVGVNFDLRSGALSTELGVNATAEMTDRKLTWVRAGAGERADHLELSVMVFVAAVTDERETTLEAIAAGFGITPAQVEEVPHALIGSIPEMVETLLARRERFGFSYIVFTGQVLEAMAPLVAALAGT